MALFVDNRRFDYCHNFKIWKHEIEVAISLYFRAYNE